MFVRKALISLACAGLVFGSSAAAAAPVAVDDVRAASPVAKTEGLRGGWGWMLALIIIAGVIGVIASDTNEDLPESP
jgi:hypothetical protein